MAATNNLAEMDIFTYAVFWKATTVGYIKDVDPSGLSAIVKEKKVGNFYDQVIDRVHVGVTGSVKTVLHQVKAETIKQLCPWWTTGPIPLAAPTIGFSEYANAGILRLHPFGVADATVTDDITYLKAFPIFTPPKASGDWRELEVTWNIYPDQTDLAAGSLTTHFFGALPE
jgi:hypothetical protein